MKSLNSVSKQDSIPVGCAPSACQPYVFLWPPLDVSTSRGLGPQVDKFEQVFSDDHQMSVVGEVGRYPGSMSGERVSRVRSNVS